MPRPPHRPARRTLPVIAACAAALLSGGCAEHSATARPPSASASAPTSAPASTSTSTSIEEIAAAVGCSAEVSVQAEELRQGGCQTGQGAFRMVTFAAAEGQTSWLAEARMYGGSYLVGDRWVVTAQPPEALAALRTRLGGSLEAPSGHAGHGAASPAGG
ncbi:hypothetical protein ACFWBN_11475 [Streptomyces sp. NPDC059989]|uniref:hypothetical protein n=1 Tax=Streptomyces sp. NPDC059989 TaxID=3347026 RepID=UPI0036AF7EF1